MRARYVASPWGVAWREGSPEGELLARWDDWGRLAFSTPTWWHLLTDDDVAELARLLTWEQRRRAWAARAG